MAQQMSVLGIDIAKQVFHVVGMDDRGGTVKLTAFKAMQETQVVGGQWFCAYAAVSVAVISRQICRL
jgi:hypothetical protein